MNYNVIWFILWGALWAAYFMLDGFDLGAGILYPFLGRDEALKSAIRGAIGPVWDGNEVWLVTAGGATFAAFPAAYARLFSGLYLAMLLILLGLIFRGVSLEFRNKGESSGWKRLWDGGFFLGSLVPALLFGIAFGNLFRGLPLDARGYHGTLLTLLNPYGLLTGLLFVLLFLVHGSLWIALRGGDGLGEKSVRLAGSAWYGLLGAAAAFLVWSFLGTRLGDNYLERPVLMAVPVLSVLSLISTRVGISRRRLPAAFVSSCATIVLLVAAGLIGIFPNLIPSRLDPDYSLTIYNASSSAYTLKVMTIVALAFVPVIIAYQVWVFRVFRTKSVGNIY